MPCALKNHIFDQRYRGHSNSKESSTSSTSLVSVSTYRCGCGKLECLEKGMARQKSDFYDDSFWTANSNVWLFNQGSLVFYNFWASKLSRSWSLSSNWILFVSPSTPSVISYFLRYEYKLTSRRPHFSQQIFSNYILDCSRRRARQQRDKMKSSLVIRI